MASLYDRIAARPGGLSDLAAARLRRNVLLLLDDAVTAAGLTERELAAKVGVRLRRLRRILNGGEVSTTLLAELLHAAGCEAEVRLVPAGEPRSRALRP